MAMLMMAMVLLLMMGVFGDTSGSQLSPLMASTLIDVASRYMTKKDVEELVMLKDPKGDIIQAIDDLEMQLRMEAMDSLTAWTANRAGKTAEIIDSQQQLVVALAAANVAQDAVNTVNGAVRDTHLTIETTIKDLKVANEVLTKNRADLQMAAQTRRISKENNDAIIAQHVGAIALVKKLTTMIENYSGTDTLLVKETMKSTLNEVQTHSDVKSTIDPLMRNMKKAMKNWQRTDPDKRAAIQKTLISILTKLSTAMQKSLDLWQSIETNSLGTFTSVSQPSLQTLIDTSQATTIKLQSQIDAARAALVTANALLAQHTVTLDLAKDTVVRLQLIISGLQANLQNAGVAYTKGVEVNQKSLDDLERARQFVVANVDGMTLGDNCNPAQIDCPRCLYNSQCKSGSSCSAEGQCTVSTRPPVVIQPPQKDTYSIALSSSTKSRQNTRVDEGIIPQSSFALSEFTFLITYKLDSDPTFSTNLFAVVPASVGHSNNAPFPNQAALFVSKTGHYEINLFGPGSFSYYHFYYDVLSSHVGKMITFALSVSAEKKQTIIDMSIDGVFQKTQVDSWDGKMYRYGSDVEVGVFAGAPGYSVIDGWIYSLVRHEHAMSSTDMREEILKALTRSISQSGDSSPSSESPTGTPKKGRSQATPATTAAAPDVTPEQPQATRASAPSTAVAPDVSPEQPQATPAPAPTTAAAPDVSPEQHQAMRAPAPTTAAAPDVNPEQPQATPVPATTTAAAPDVSPEQPQATPATAPTTAAATDMSPEQPQATPAPAPTTAAAPDVSPEQPQATPAPAPTTAVAPDVTPEQPKATPAPAQTTAAAPDVSPEQPSATPAPAPTTAAAPPGQPQATPAPAPTTAAVPDVPEQPQATPAPAPTTAAAPPGHPQATPAPAPTTAVAPDVTPEQPKATPAPAPTTAAAPTEQPQATPAPAPTMAAGPDVSPEQPQATPAPAPTTAAAPDVTPKQPGATPTPAPTTAAAPDMSPEKPVATPAPVSTTAAAPEVSPQQPQATPAPAPTTAAIPDTKPATPAPNPGSTVSVPNVFAIQHQSGMKCVHPQGGQMVPDNNRPLIFNGNCDVDRLRYIHFTFLSLGQIQHVSSGKCIHPLGGAEVPAGDTKLVLWPECVAANRPTIRFRVLENGRIQHISSGMCVHPIGGSDKPDDGTNLVLWADCSMGRGAAIRYNFIAPSPISNPQYETVIQHQTSLMCIHPIGGKLVPDNDTPLVLWPSCDDGRFPYIRYTFLSLGQIMQVSSGMCFHPIGGRDNPEPGTKLVLWPDCTESRGPAIRYNVLSNGRIQHVSSLMCVHPEGGKDKPDDETRLVLFPDCGLDRGNAIRYTFNPSKDPANPGSTVSVPVIFAIQQQSGMKCAHPKGGQLVPDNNTPMIFYGNCDVNRLRFIQFKMLSLGQIQHVSSGKCIHPLGGAEVPAGNTELVFWPDCGVARGPTIRFRVLENGRIQHVSSGMCVHPIGGSDKPDDGTKLILWADCSMGRGAAIRYNFIAPSPISNPQYETVIQHQTSLMCIHPIGGKLVPDNDTPLVLWPSCDDGRFPYIRYKFLSLGQIMQVSSGMCFHPIGGRNNPEPGTKLVLWPDCTESRGPAIRYNVLSNGRIQHVSSGMCVHPEGGKDKPDDETRLVLFPDCTLDRGNAIRYTFKQV